MFDIEKNIRLAELYSIYGDLIKSKQKDILNDYFNFDMTISEIAENRNISKQAVFDLIKKKSSLLEKFESTLHIWQSRQDLNKNLNFVLKNLDNAQKVEMIIKKILEEN